MSDGMKKFLWCYLPIFLICLALNCWGMYYFMFLSGNVTITTSYIDEATYSEDEKYFINLEYFSNAYENGIENFGARWDYYTDVSIPEKNEDGSYGDKYAYSTGVQFQNGYSYSEKVNTNYWNYSYNYYQMENCVYYNTSDGVSFSATNSLEDMNKWIYDMDGQLCLIQEKGETNEYKTLWVDRGTNYNTAMLLCDLYDVVKSLPDGERVITVDLSKYYNVFLFDGKEFSTTPTTEENWVYVSVYVNKTSNGLISANQSMFNSYLGDSTWSLYGDMENEDYWQAKTEYYLELADFTFDYENGKYYLKLQSQCIEYLSEFKNMRYLLSLDLDNIYLGNQKINVSGFSENAFGGLNVEEITLTSTETKTFTMYDKNIKVNAPDNIEIEYLEVQNV